MEFFNDITKTLRQLKQDTSSGVEYATRYCFPEILKQINGVKRGSDTFRLEYKINDFHSNRFLSHDQAKRIGNLINGQVEDTKVKVTKLYLINVLLLPEDLFLILKALHNNKTVKEFGIALSYHSESDVGDRSYYSYDYRLLYKKIAEMIKFNKSITHFEIKGMEHTDFIVTDLKTLSDGLQFNNHIQKIVFSSSRSPRSYNSNLVELPASFEGICTKHLHIYEKKMIDVLERIEKHLQRNNQPSENFIKDHNYDMTFKFL
jgi:hypothetical protein